MNDAENPAARVATPWGVAGELKGRRLYPGAGTPPEEVARNQRERLFGAIVALVSANGYEATTVADVLALCGVSRSAFYQHFANKSECLTAAAASLLDPALGALAAADGNGGTREAKAVFEGFFGQLRAQPAAARVCFVELHAAGEEGEALGRRAFEALSEAVARLNGPNGGGEWSPELSRALLAGVRKLIHTRLARGEESELERLAPELWRWLEGVIAPPAALVVPRRQRSGTQARFQGYTPSERIARAVAAVVSEKGYGETSTDDIAAEAAISLSTFYAHFADKQDAVLGALEMSGAQVMALAVPAARRAAGWQQGVRALYEAICAYFAAEPEMAGLAMVGVYGAGPKALARRDRVIDSLMAMLAPGMAETPHAPAVTTEAIGATVYALMREQVLEEGPESLGAIVPLATYLTLVTFLGPDRALEVANGEGARKR